MKDTIKILFNEDVKLDAELIWRELENCGIVFEKLLVDNKKGFLEGLKSFNPDIVISDYSLPQFDGMKALHIRNEISPQTPFILVTGSNNETVAVECMKAGADDYILKDNLARLGHSVINAITRAKVLLEKNTAEAELKGSFSLMEATFESIHNGILVVGSDGDVIKANKKFSEMWHISKEVLDSRDDNKLLESILDQLTDPDEFVEGVKELYENPKSESVDMITFKDGRIFERISKPMYLGSEPKGRVWSFLDITERIQSEEALKQSELRFKQISENSGEWIWEVDKNGLYTYSSSVVKDILGYEPEEIINKMHFYDLFTPETRDQMKQGAMDAFAKKVVFSNFINPNLHKDGSVAILSTSGLPLVDDEGNLIGYRGVDTNITERKKAEEALAQSKREFQNYFESGSVGMSVTLPDRRWIEVNQKLCQMLGYSKEELLSMNWTDISHPDDLAKNLELFQKSLDGKIDNYELEKRFVRKDGKVIYVTTSVVCERKQDGTIHHFLASYNDVTERVIAEEKIQHERIMLRTLIDNLPDLIYVKDNEGRKLIANLADVRNIGFTSEEEVIGKTDLELFPGEVGLRGHADDMEIINSGKAIFGREEDFVDADGLKQWILTTKVPLKDKNGQIAGLVGVGHDITNIKLNETELISAKEKAEESDRLKTAFLHNISHEIRTPMNAIVGFSALLGEPEIDNPTRQSYIEMIMQGSNHLLSIISDIVDISNIEANLVKIAKNEISLNSTLKTLYTQFLSKAREKKIKFLCKDGLSDDDASIITDATKLVQILSNLLSNAIKFTDKGSIEMEYKKDGSFLKFSVTDTGIGIAPEFHQKIFDRFYQVASSNTRLYEGTGLGLAISSAYVQLLGGRMWLSSEPGKGTSFFFTLPYLKQINESQPATVHPTNQDFVFKNKMKILVAEDIESNYSLISYFLSGANTELVRARTGKEAVDKCLTDKSIGMVLMDIKMPEMDGYSATKIIREANILIPIIAQTAYADDKDKALEAGCSGLISKPFDRKSLLKVLSEFI